MAHAELPVLHDAFTAAITSGCQKTSYIVQFLWRDLTSGFELIGPYISVPKSVDSNVKKVNSFEVNPFLHTQETQ